MDLLSLLFHLARCIGGSRILLLATYRPEDVDVGHNDEGHPLDAVTSELKRISGNIWIYLNCIERAERRQFVDSILDSEPSDLGEQFRQRLFRHTDGHALFTVELVYRMKKAFGARMRL